MAHVVPRLRTVLIIPPGHAETLRDRRRLTRREIWMVGGVLGAVAALALVLVISFASSGPSSKSGCIYATIPAATGAAAGQPVRRRGAVDVRIGADAGRVHGPGGAR